MPSSRALPTLSRHVLRPMLLAAASLTPALPALAAPAGDDTVLEARDAFRDRDAARVSTARAALVAAGHPLAMWAEYWELSLRLPQAQSDEVDAFFARWRGSYVEDRMRNDWLLELGRRRDWPRVAEHWARFRMRDDREVECYAAVARLTLGEDALADAQRAWLAQREADEGCNLLGQTLRSRSVLADEPVWRKLRAAIDNNQPRHARQLASLLGKEVVAAMPEVLDAPSRVLKRQRRSMGETSLQLAALALVRLAATDPDGSAEHLRAHWSALLPKEAAAWAWAGIARQAAFRLAPQATDYYEQAWLTHTSATGTPTAAGGGPAEPPQPAPAWSDEILAWQVRAALRTATASGTEAAARARAWRQVLQAVGAMSASARRDPAWVYWKARAQLALPALPTPPAEMLAEAGAPADAAGRAAGRGLPASGAPASRAAELTGSQIAALRAQDPATPPAAASGVPAQVPPPRAPATTTHTAARGALGDIAGASSFYALLAAEELGRPEPPPPKPRPVSSEERTAIRTHPGLGRAMHLFRLGLRSEAVREWNYNTGFGQPVGSEGGSARPLSDRQLLAAAQWACEQSIWDRCIQAADRTRDEIDLALRFPTPFRKEVIESARAARLDPAYVYGLIRQESRFMTAAKSSVGASGLMQLMPATAAWTARKLGVTFTADEVHDPKVNIRLGIGYLKLALDNFGGSQALAAAAYNAGPGRPRKWRQGDSIDAAAWAEGIPFGETRDYVKRVLANAWAYQTVLTGKPSTLRARLGQRIGPNEPSSTVTEPDLP